jgi:tetratricopeptide (TPR) repeat protein
MSAKLEQLEQKLELEEAEASLSASGEVCASCGIAAVDDVKLKDCNGGCDLVLYCSDKCQESHREQHEEDCKKRKAELHDKKLFTQPDISHLGECPICCLPMPIYASKSTLMGCCCKIICDGCNFANQMREDVQGLESRCAFCRNPAPNSDEEHYKNVMKRIKKNNPVAMVHMGRRHYCEGDYQKAVEYWAKAAKLGDVDAHYCMGSLYYKGNGVDKDEKKAVYHWEKAAIGGHHHARVTLAAHEKIKGRFDRAAKHYIIAANLGCDTSLQYIKQLFVEGIASKEDYAAALRGYQTAVDAIKSAERDEGEAFLEEFRKLEKQLDGTK